MDDPNARAGCLSVLILDDSPLDAESAAALLAKDGLVAEVRRVETEADFVRCLVGARPDLILSDYTLPGYDGLFALGAARQLAPDVPFIFVSGEMGEDVAVEALKHGATDVVPKHRPDRLAPAVRRALGESRERAERQRAEAALRASEERFRLLVEAAVDYAIMVLDDRGHIAGWNAGAERLIGYAGGEVVGRSYALLFTEEDRRAGRPERELATARETGRAADDNWAVRKDGSRFWASGFTYPFKADGTTGFVKIFRDLTDRRRLEDSLRRQAEELAERDQRKDEFLATLAHELRNPLAPLRNAVQILKLAGTDPQKVGLVRGLIERQVGQLVRLLDDLLDVSRINRNMLALLREPVDLGRVVELAVESSRPALDAAGHALAVAPPPAPVTVNADPTRLTQVLSNLLTNAARYTPPGGRVTVTAGTEGGSAVVRVTDTGIGIAAGDLHRIFEPFTQVGQVPGQPPEGLGIGLSLVKTLVELHGGTVTADSAGPGRGSTFTVRLPLAATSGPIGNPDTAVCTESLKL